MFVKFRKGYNSDEPFYAKIEDGSHGRILGSWIFEILHNIVFFTMATEAN